MRFFTYIFSALFIVLIMAAIGFIGLDIIAKKAGPLDNNKTVVINRGKGAITIANVLEKEGVIENALLFRLAVRMEGAGRELKAGEYLFEAETSMRDVINIIRQGKSVGYFFTAIEGFTVRQITNQLGVTEHLVGEIEQMPAEGSILPETYQYERGATRQSVIEQMQKAADAVWAEEWPKRADNLPFKTIEEAKILASIVEKETSIAEERATVAGVFINRLRKGMLLQADPTIVYFVSDKLGSMRGKRLYSKHLKRDNPYNTYKNVGLPPTPIGNAGRGVIHATLHPEENDYIFFVADGTGGHVFAETLAEHNKNVREWREYRKKTGK